MEPTKTTSLSIFFLYSSPSSCVHFTTNLSRVQACRVTQGGMKPLETVLIFAKSKRLNSDVIGSPTETVAMVFRLSPMATMTVE